jgi:redox-sensitive bicupin YhaK (pirin superfamily)
MLTGDTDWVRVPGIDVHRAADRFLTRTDWLTSRHAFSFGEHYDPDNVGHGSLLVSNDEVVASGRGFDDHPHRDTEIVTWVLSGSLVHEDSAGHRGTVYPGLAQRLTAGAGVVHAERNDAYRLDPTRPAEPVHYVQMWVRPDVSGGAPSYQQREFDLGDLAADWLPVASGSRSDATVSLGSASSTLWATVLGGLGTRVLPAAPFVHLYLARGEVDVEAVGRLATGDSVRLSGEASLRVTGVTDAELLVWEMGA